MIHVVGALAALVDGGRLELLDNGIRFGCALNAGNAANHARDRCIFGGIARRVRGVAGVRQITRHIAVAVALRWIFEREMRYHIRAIEEDDLVGVKISVDCVHRILALALVVGRGNGFAL